MGYFLNQPIVQRSNRGYHVYVPDNPVAAQLPAIIVFHGGGQRVEVVARRWGIDLNPAAPNPPVPPMVEDYMLVFPEADPHLGDKWVHAKAENLGVPDHDLRFVTDLIGDLTTRAFPTMGVNVSADPAYLYAAGFSNGGGMVWQLAYSTLVLSFQGFAAVGRTLDPEKVDRYRGATPAVPFIYIHGTADKGFRSPMVQIEAPLDTTFPAYTVQQMLSRNGVAAGTPATTRLIPGSTNITEVVAQLFVGAAAFGAVTVINGGHNWPTPATSANPPVAVHFNATEMILQFWRTHAGLP